MSGSPETRDYFLELYGLPDTAEPISSYFWNERGNLRQFRDTVVVRNALSPEETQLAYDQIEYCRANEDLPDPIGAEGLEHVKQLAWQINLVAKAKIASLAHFTAQGSIDAHVDLDYSKHPGPGGHLGLSKGAVFSIGLNKPSIFGFNPRLRSWRIESSEGALCVDGTGGHQPRIEDMRTVVEQNPGDLVVIRPGIVHIVIANDERKSLLIAQNNQHD